MISRARKRVVVQWPMIAWLAIVWVFLWGDISVANIVNGVVIGLVVTFLFPLPPVAYSGRPHMLGLIVLTGRFLWDIVAASAQVARLALSPKRLPLEAVIAVQLRSKSDLYLTLTGEFVSLVPGSLIVETQRRTGVLYVHWLDVDGAEGVERARRNVLEQEERILRALASPAELEAAGLSSGRSWWRRPSQGSAR